MLQFVINGIQNGLEFENIVAFVAALGIFHLLVCICENLFYSLFVPISNKKIHQHIQKQLFSKAASVELACYENSSFYDKYVKAISAAAGKATDVLYSLCSITNCIFTLCTVSLIIFKINPLLIAFALVPFIVSLLFGKKLNKVQYDYSMESQEKSRKKDYVRRVFYLADYAKEMRLTEINKLMFKKFYESIKELKNIIKKYGPKVALLDYIFLASNDVIMYLGTVLYSAYKTVVTKTMLYGDCLVVINSIGSVSWALRNIIDIFIQFQNHSLYIDNLRYFLEYEPTLSHNPNGLTANKNALITLKNVYFKYDGQDSHCLKNINLSIKPGEKIALVGNNGAGKTSLVKILMRLYDVTEGEVILDGENIKDYELKSYRNLFSVAFQDFKVFSLSALENVLLKDHITDKDIQSAIESMKSAGIYDKISSLHNEYNTVLTREFDENGAILSGGEFQKISIARAFAKKAPIVILDEPSSALDPLAEYAMYESMLSECKGKTVVFISHRLSSAVLADKIYLLENGEIIESGSHTQLLKKRGKYSDMWNKQALKYYKSE